MRTLAAIGMYVGVGALVLVYVLVAIPPSVWDWIAEKRRNDRT